MSSYSIPDAEPRNTPAISNRELLFGRIKVQIAGAIFLQRIGINQSLGGQVFPFPVSLFLTPILLVWNLATGAATLPMKRIGPYILFIAMALASTLINNGGGSFTSLLLIAGIYAMFACPVALDEPEYKRYFRLMANVAVFVCLLGSAAYFIQFVFKAQWLFSWRSIVPRQFLIEFNTLNMMRWPAELYKANGFFLMEASYQSQLAARVLLICIFILRDWRYLPPLALALLTAYSGTGILLFMIFGIVPLVLALMKTRYLKMLMPVAFLMLPLGLLVFWDKLDLGLFLDRLDEFNNPRSSGYARFVNSQLMLRVFSSGDTLHFLFGNGPGSSEVFGAHMNSVGEATTVTWIKLLLEYGVIGFGAFFLFFYKCMQHTLRSHWLALAFCFHYFLLDSGFAVPQQAFMTLMLGGFVCLKLAPSQTARAPSVAPVE